MVRVLKCLGAPLVAVAMLALAGGHWAVLQSVAWGQMIWTYTQETGSLAEAIQKTFDGANPCSMCRAITQGKKNERQSPRALEVAKKAEIFLMAETDSLRPPAPRERVFPARVFSLEDHPDAPPTPVPIASV